MKLPRSPKDRLSKGSTFVRICLIAGFICLTIGLVFWLSDGGGSYDASGLKASSNSGGVWQRLGVRVIRRKTVRSTRVLDTFGTLFHGELMSKFGLHDWKEENAARLLGVLRNMERTKIKSVIFSVSWDYIAHDDQNLRWEYLDNLVGTACGHTGLKVAMIVDMLRAPNWLFKRFPEAEVRDAGGRNYSRMSWFHEPANMVALDMLKAVAEHMSSKYAGCVVAVQPVYNNEYEAKYTQEHDAYQDYSSHALEAYRSWLRAKKQNVPQLNRRWSTSFSDWSDVKPPAILSGMMTGVEEGARYWDWLRFREEFGASVFNRACSTIKAAGLKCFHHFPEFFTVLDAIYCAPMFRRIAASEHTDFLIMDSNFMTPYQTVVNPVKLRMYISAAHSYGKPVYFEAAVERNSNLELIRAGYKNAMLAGATNLGLTNWLSMVDLNTSLTETIYALEPACPVKEVVGVFLHLQSCMVFQGLQWQWKDWDPLHYFVEDIAERLTADCTTDVAVHIELHRFLADLPTFDRVVFVEPLVLYGNAELSSYVAAKNALQGIPHELLHMPTNSSRGLQLKVFQDL